MSVAVLKAVSALKNLVVEPSDAIKALVAEIEGAIDRCATVMRAIHDEQKGKHLRYLLARKHLATIKHTTHLTLEVTGAHRAVIDDTTRLTVIDRFTVDISIKRSGCGVARGVTVVSPRWMLTFCCGKNSTFDMQPVVTANSKIGVHADQTASVSDIAQGFRDARYLRDYMMTLIEPITPADRDACLENFALESIGVSKPVTDVLGFTEADMHSVVFEYARIP